MDSPAPDGPSGVSITPETIAEAMRLIGLDVTDAECRMMIDSLRGGRGLLEQLRAAALDNSVPLALTLWVPSHGGPRPADQSLEGGYAPLGPPRAAHTATTPKRPADLEDVAFLPITALAHLIRTREITSVELTEMYLERLRRLDPLLHSVVTLTGDIALAQARRADDEIARGHHRGPLHGIPWGVKDVVATRGARTTWGAAPYRDQTIDVDATVVSRLAAAGAVLVAKLATGVLAVDDDQWFGGQTRNPWDPREGASGSSAGPAAATAAGLVGCAIGTETLGSIVAPSARCGVTGLRPTYGRVSRHGVMTLSWTVDTIGPMCRSAEDCAVVFDAIHGPDGIDPTVVDRPFRWDPDLAVRGLRIGYVERRTDGERDEDRYHDETLAVLRSLGATLVPITLPDYPYDALRIIVLAEAAAAFDELTRGHRGEPLAPHAQFDVLNAFRAARLIPAVEYIQANRIRAQLIQSIADVMSGIDLYVRPNLADRDRLIASYTGSPAVAVPDGFSDAGTPASSVAFVGHPYDEARLLAVAKAYQDATDFHRRHPPLPS